MDNRDVTTIRLNKELNEKWSDLAKREGMTKNVILIRALKMFIDYKNNEMKKEG